MTDPTGGDGAGTRFKVGDLVVPDRNPTTVQEVVDVIQSGTYGPMLRCRTVWRFDTSKPISPKPLAPAAAWSYRHLTRGDVLRAREGLRQLWARLLDGDPHPSSSPSPTTGSSVVRFDFVGRSGHVVVGHPAPLAADFRSTGSPDDPDFEPDPGDGRFPHE